MGPSPVCYPLPDSKSPELCLDHPTPEECITIWTNTSTAWKDSLTFPAFMKESLFLTTVPLAKDSGMTNWILVDKNLPPGQRPILCSCESFRKRSLVSDTDGNVSDTIIHGIASVFCQVSYRGRGYAARMMKELAEVLRHWQTDSNRCVGSILYSDIGKSYYSTFGWHSTPTNSHLVFQPSKSPTQLLARLIPEKDLAQLCKKDELMIRKDMATPAKRMRKCVSVIPDLDHMLWHIRKEDFGCDFLFGKVPFAKGAIAGQPGNQIWVIWTHRYYSHPDSSVGDNTLYILRLVFENADMDSNSNSYLDLEKKAALRSDQVDNLRAILEAARDEAAHWKLDDVKLWHPTPAVQKMIVQSGIEYSAVERDEDSISCGLWYNENDDEGIAIEWINNEHYAWC